jgi:hypothetical protein
LLCLWRDDGSTGIASVYYQLLAFVFAGAITDIHIELCDYPLLCN